MTLSSKLLAFLRSIARAYRNTLAASSFIEQNKPLKAKFRKGVERPSIIWLSGMFGFVVAWAATGLSDKVSIGVSQTVCAGMLGWFISHIMILSLMLWLYRRDALTELTRVRSNRFMHRMFETAEEHVGGISADPVSHVTGIAQMNGDPMVVKRYALDIFTWLMTHQLFMCNNKQSAFVFALRPDGGVMHDTIKLADFFTAAAANTDVHGRQC